MNKNQIKSGKVYIDDISCSYYIKKATKNEEKVIIFIHGFPFNKNSWRPQLEVLQENITGIAIDVRGHGLSTTGHGFFSIDVFAKDLRRFIDKLNLKNIVLCGVSMGGYIALRSYQLNKTDVVGLILSDTHHKADDNIAKKKRFDSIQAILKYGRRPFAIGFVDNLFTKETVNNNIDLIELIKSSIRRNSIRNICATQLALASRLDSSEYLKDIDVPTLIVRGVEDKITPRNLMVELHESIKNSSFIEIENAGHLPNLENATAFNSEMNSFLK